MWFLAPLVGHIGRSVASIVARDVIGSMVPGLTQGGAQGGHIKIKVKANLKDTGRYIHDIGKQIRYATTVALTRTAKRLVPIMEAEAMRSFKNPTRFTVRAFGSTMATKENLTSTLYIKPKQASYLLPNIEGGRRTQKSFERRLASESGVDAYWVPGSGLRLKAAGNLTIRQISEIANRLRQSGKYREVFVGVPKGHSGAPFGIWARIKRGRGRSQSSGIQPLLIKITIPLYKKRFDFYGIGKRHAQRIFNEEFERAYEQAIRSVRPVSRQLNLITTFTIRL